MSFLNFCLFFCLFFCSTNEKQRSEGGYNMGPINVIFSLLMFVGVHGSISATSVINGNTQESRDCLDRRLIKSLWDCPLLVRHNLRKKKKKR